MKLLVHIKIRDYLPVQVQTTECHPDIAHDHIVEGDYDAEIRTAIRKYPNENDFSFDVDDSEVID